MQAVRRRSFLNCQVQTPKSRHFLKISGLLGLCTWGFAQVEPPSATRQRIFRQARYAYCMNDETRQFGYDDSSQPRPKQYFPDQQHLQHQQQYQQYQQPQYQPEYDQYYVPEPEKRSNALPVTLAVLLLLALAAGAVLFFLWQDAAAEAKKPPVTETLTLTTTATVTETQQETITETPTRRLPRLPERGTGEDGPVLEVPQDVRDTFGDLLSGAESALQGQ